MKRSIIIALGLAALAAPVANAGGPARLSPVQRIIAQEDAGRITLLRRHAVTAQATPAQIVVTVAAGGFDWGDAGIGGAAAVALVLLGAGGVVLIRDGRRLKVHG